MSVQERIRGHFEKFTQEIKQARKNKQVELIHDGDAIDGDHHHSGDVCTLSKIEQADIHIQLMTELQKRIGWERGDRLYYTAGTPIHVGDDEDYIGSQMNAIQNGEYHTHQLLKLDTNGTHSWFVHHGKAPGDGANEGNSLRNWLKAIYIDAGKDEIRSPDVVYTGHVHTPTYANYVYRHKLSFGMVHGVILPSWQAKTRYAHMVAPVARNKIGGVYHDITADGHIVMPPVFSCMDTE
jgi:hypothetical protein